MLTIIIVFLNKTHLKLKELVMLAPGIFAGLFFTPDIGKIVYVFNNKMGAFLYNIFHHKGLAIYSGWWGFTYITRFYD